MTNIANTTSVYERKYHFLSKGPDHKVVMTGGTNALTQAAIKFKKTIFADLEF